MKKLILMWIALAATPALAQEVAPKAVTRIDFNRMINENNNVRAELKKDLDEKAEQAELELADEKTRVIDFLDVEVGVGEAPPIVDRRFDSIGEARPYEGASGT